jgi:hypothetical protein
MKAPHRKHLMTLAVLPLLGRLATTEAEAEADGASLTIRAEQHQVLAARRGSQYGQQFCAWAAHLVPEPRGRWPCPFSHAGRLG